jgi:hypothetical protein
MPISEERSAFDSEYHVSYAVEVLQEQEKFRDAILYPYAYTLLILYT